MSIKAFIYRIFYWAGHLFLIYEIVATYRSNAPLSDNNAFILGFSIIFDAYVLIFSFYDLLVYRRNLLFPWFVVLLIPIIGSYLYFEKILVKNYLLHNPINKLNPKPNIDEKELVSTMLRRFGAALFDYIIIMNILFWLIMTYGKLNEDGTKTLTGGEAWYIVPFWFLYLPISEFLFGRTLGKLLFGVKVVRGDGSKINFVGAFRRHFVDLLDLFCFFFMFIRFRKSIKLPRRIGDYLAHSWVIRSKIIL